MGERMGSEAPILRPPSGRSAADYLPSARSLDALRQASQGCRGCDLWERATQAVFGEGRRDAPLMLVGEQPGHEEDLSGHPFVGPSGRLLDEALSEAGIARGDAYVTNVVKHFKWEPRGKRRIHKKPTELEARACGPWLRTEIEVVRPIVLLCLGATAAQFLLGRGVSVTRQRGQWLDSALAPRVGVTIHPSAILRIERGQERRDALEAYVEDFRWVGRALAEVSAHLRHT
jgi:DNA polymerase